MIQNSASQEVTILSNQFIDHYMPAANGEFVKVYLYLLRLASSSLAFHTAAVADVFDCTERDVIRAMRYWEKAGLLQLTFENRKLAQIALLTIPEKSPAEVTMSAAVLEEAVTTAPAEAPTLPEPVLPPLDQPKKTAPVKETAAPEAAPLHKTLSASQKQSLQEKDEVRQFLYIAEQYLGRTLTKTDMDNLLYFYAELHFSADLIEYLVEYCVSKGSKSCRYIETVALAWAQEGITSVMQAKESTNLYNRQYFTILKAMGIKNRNPVEQELTYINTWLKEYDFSLEIITEACQRAVLQTGQPSFQYADSILKSWNKQQVRHLSDIQKLDDAHKQRAAKTSAKTAKAPKTNQFTEYPHRDYDYEEIKKSLFKQ